MLSSLFLILLLLISHAQSQNPSSFQQPSIATTISQALLLQQEALLLHQKAVSLHGSGEYSKALTTISQSLKLDPTNSLALNDYGSILRITASYGGYKGFGTDGNSISEYYNDLLRSVTAFKRSIALDNTNAHAMLSLAELFSFFLYGETSNIQYLLDSFGYYESSYKLMSLNPILYSTDTRLDSLHKHAAALNKSNHKHHKTKAIELLQVAHNLSPTHLKTLEMLSLYHLDLFDFSSALTYSNLALKLYPASPQLHHNHNLILHHHSQFSATIAPSSTEVNSLNLPSTSSLFDDSSGMEDKSEAQYVYINLETSTERNESSHGELVKHGKKFKSFNALTPLTRPEMVILPGEEYTMYATEVELACLASHIMAIVSMKDSVHEYVVIMEDDCEFKHVFDLDKMWQSVPSDVEAIQLNTNPSDEIVFAKVYQANLDNEPFVQHELGMWAAMSYSIRTSSIKRLLPLLKNNRITASFGTRPVADIFLYNFFRTLTLTYPMFTNSPHMSTLHPEYDVHNRHNLKILASAGPCEKINDFLMV